MSSLILKNEHHKSEGHIRECYIKKGKGEFLLSERTIRQMCLCPNPDGIINDNGVKVPCPCHGGLAGETSAEFNGRPCYLTQEIKGGNIRINFYEERTEKTMTKTKEKKESKKEREARIEEIISRIDPEYGAIIPGHVRAILSEPICSEEYLHSLRMFDTGGIPVLEFIIHNETRSSSIPFIQERINELQTSESAQATETGVSTEAEIPSIYRYNCSGCGRISDERKASPYSDLHPGMYCPACYKARIAAKVGEAQAPQVYLCETCGSEFPPDKAADVDGNIVCPNCFDKINPPAPQPAQESVSASPAVNEQGEAENEAPVSFEELSLPELTWMKTELQFSLTNINKQIDKKKDERTDIEIHLRAINGLIEIAKQRTDHQLELPLTITSPEQSEELEQAADEILEENPEDKMSATETVIAQLKNQGFIKDAEAIIAEEVAA